MNKNTENNLTEDGRARVDILDLEEDTSLDLRDEAVGPAMPDLEEAASLDMREDEAVGPVMPEEADMLDLEAADLEDADSSPDMREDAASLDMLEEADILDLEEAASLDMSEEADILDLEEAVDSSPDLDEDIQFLDLEQANGRIFHDNGDAAEDEEGEPRSLIREIISWVIPMVIAVAVALVLKNYVIINANVPTGSMLNTIQEGDDLFGLRLAYQFSDPKRGDIVIFYAPDDPSQKYIKRIIGEPGDKVVIKDALIYINDAEEPLEEEYLPEEWVEGTGPYEFNVPEGCYLMLGDNRNNSSDARLWNHTYVSRDAIIGKAWFIYYPFSHMKFL